MSTAQARMVVNAAGLYAQTLAHRMQGLPEETIPEQFLARGHYCTMEGQCRQYNKRKTYYSLKPELHMDIFKSLF